METPARRSMGSRAWAGCGGALLPFLGTLRISGDSATCAIGERKIAHGVGISPHGSFAEPTPRFIGIFSPAVAEFVIASDEEHRYGQTRICRFESPFMRFDCIARNPLAALERCGRYGHTQRIAKLRSLMTPFKALFGIALRTARLGAERGQKKHCAGVIQRRCLLEVIERSAIIAGDAYAFAVSNAK